MTLAICLRCGREKVGAFTPCPRCRYDPSGDKLAEAKALLLSDHHAKPQELRAASAAIQAGQEVPFDADAIDQLVGELERAQIPSKMPLGCALLVWVPVVVMVVLAALVVFVWSKL